MTSGNDILFFSVMKVSAVSLLLVFAFVVCSKADHFFDPFDFDSPESEITTITYSDYFYDRLTGFLFSAIPAKPTTGYDNMPFLSAPVFFDYWTTYWSSVRSFGQELPRITTYTVEPVYGDTIGSNWYGTPASGAEILLPVISCVLVLAAL